MLQVAWRVLLVVTPKRKEMLNIAISQSIESALPQAEPEVRRLAAASVRFAALVALGWIPFPLKSPRARFSD